MSNEFFGVRVHNPRLTTKTVWICVVLFVILTAEHEDMSVVVHTLSEGACVLDPTTRSRHI